MKWQSSPPTQGPQPAARGGHAGVSIGEKCIYFGGADRNLKVFDDVLVLSKSSKETQWEKTKIGINGKIPCLARTGCSFNQIGNIVYIFGGQDPRLGTAFNDVLLLDTTTWTISRFEVKGGSPPPRHSHSSVNLNDHCLIVFGGAGQDGPLNDAWILDTKTCCWTYPAVKGAIPAAREMHAAAVVGDKLAIFGGRDISGRVLQDICCLDVAKMEWAKPVRTNFPRCAHTCVPVSFRDSIVAGVVGTVREGDGAGGADGESQEGLVVFGGFSGNQVENSLLFIDKDLDSVQDISDQVSGPLPKPRFAHVANAVRDEASGHTKEMLVFGGVEPQEDLSDVAVLSFE